MWMCTSVRTQNCVLTKCHFLNMTRVDTFMQKQSKVLESTVLAPNPIFLPDWVASSRCMNTPELWFRALLKPGKEADL